MCASNRLSGGGGYMYIGLSVVFKSNRSTKREKKIEREGEFHIR